MFYYYNILKITSGMRNILYVFDEFGIIIKAYEICYTDDTFEDFSRKIYLSRHIITCGAFGNFSNKSFMMANYNKNRDDNNINSSDYKDEPDFINALVYDDKFEKQIHELSLNKIDVNDQKYTQLNTEVKNHGGKLLNLKLPVFYQNDKKLEDTQFRICNMFYDKEMIGTMIIRCDSEPEKQKYFDNPVYKYEFSNPIELDMLYDEGCLNA